MYLCINIINFAVHFSIKLSNEETENFTTQIYFLQETKCYESSKKPSSFHPHSKKKLTICNSFTYLDLQMNNHSKTYHYCVLDDQQKSYRQQICGNVTIYQRLASCRRCQVLQSKDRYVSQIDSFYTLFIAIYFDKPDYLNADFDRRLVHRFSGFGLKVLNSQNVRDLRCSQSYFVLVQTVQARNDISSR